MICTALQKTDKIITNTADNILENEINLILPKSEETEMWNYHHTGI